MQICPRLACNCRQKYMQLTGETTRIACKNTRQTQEKISANAGKNTRNRRQKYMQFADKTPAIAGKITCNCI